MSYHSLEVLTFLGIYMLELKWTAQNRELLDPDLNGTLCSLRALGSRRTKKCWTCQLIAINRLYLT